MLTSDTAIPRGFVHQGCTNRRCLPAGCLVCPECGWPRPQAFEPGLRKVFLFTVHDQLTILGPQWFCHRKAGVSFRRALTWPHPPIEALTPAGSGARVPAVVQQFWQGRGYPSGWNAGIPEHGAGIAAFRLR